MSLSVGGHKFKVSQVPFSAEVPCRVNVKKRREKVVYRALSDNDNINIEYLIGNTISPDDNVYISDRSTSLVQNRVPSADDITTETTSSFTLNVDQFLVTDIFTSPTPTQPSQPLFYVHTLENFNSTVDNFAYKELISIEFANYDLQSTELSAYVLDSTTGEFFNNLENSYNEDTGEANVTFIKYAVRTTLTNSSTIEVFHELLDNEPIYQEASFDDIDEFGILLPSVKRYLIDELLGGTQFLITMPSKQVYAYKELPESRIRLLPPTATSVSDLWNVRVTNGKFITSLNYTSTVFRNYKYQIAEFDSQTFTPYPPYKSQVEETATWITPGLCQVAKNVVDDVNLNFYVDVIVLSRTGTVKYAYSTDPQKIGTLYGISSVSYTAGILSVDQPNGFIELSGTTRDDDEILVSYVTKEEEYEFTSLDFNPVSNLDILNQRIVLYISPESVGTGSLDRSLYYLVVDPLGKIIYSSQADENAAGLDPATQKLLAEDFDTTGTPTHTFYYDKTSTTAGLASRASGVNPSSVEDFSFIDKYTVESQLFSSLTTVSGTTLENLTENGRFLVLGDVYVGESQRPTAFTEFDVRIEGGGIKDDQVTDALAEQPEAAWYWDFIARRPYPATTAFYVEVPQTLLSTHGGRFTRSEIKTLIDKHMQLGGYAALNTYGVDPTVTGVSTSSGSALIAWPSYGSSTTYAIFQSKNIDGPFSQYNNVTYNDRSAGNCVLMTGFIPNTKYYLEVRATKDSDVSAGPLVAITTTALGG